MSGQQWLLFQTLSVYIFTLSINPFEMNYFTERIYMYIKYVYKVLPSFWKVTECFPSLRVLVNLAVLVF